ncbi:hypothetical protein BDZ91DRAFT_629614, partial [Kalaharituber pfeilii]
LPLSSIPFPVTPLTTKVRNYAATRLPSPHLNHAYRTYFLGQAMVMQQFPEWREHYTDEAYLCAALLHGVGICGPAKSTRMSAEIAAGVSAWGILRGCGAEIALAEAVVESVVRQRDGEDRVFNPQDWGTDGKVPILCQILQMGMWLDNVGYLSEWIDMRTVEEVVERYPRLGWCYVLAEAMEREGREKPWGSVTKIGKEEWGMRVRGNKCMERYE